jgi:hypothetical protein
MQALGQTSHVVAAARDRGTARHPRIWRRRFSILLQRFMLPDPQDKPMTTLELSRVVHSCPRSQGMYRHNLL